MTQQKQNGNLVAIITMCFIFAMISFVTNMAAPFGNIWGNTYSWAGMMGNMMNFAAYLFMGIPAGKMLVKYGYKKTALIALAVGIVGLFVQYLSSLFGADVAVFSYDGQMVALNLIIYLLGAFICGFCVCMLNTVVNPLLTLRGGGGNTGNQLLQIGGTLNSLP
ncbi:MAG: MFS transporter, partial [Bacteroides sp.]|nr:MFS transporter [Bacteroides sp.]